MIASTSTGMSNGRCGTPTDVRAASRPRRTGRGSGREAVDHPGLLGEAVDRVHVAVDLQPAGDAVEAAELRWIVRARSTPSTRPRPPPRRSSPRDRPSRRLPSPRRAWAVAGDIGDVLPAHQAPVGQTHPGGITCGGGISGHAPQPLVRPRWMPSFSGVRARGGSSSVAPWRPRRSRRRPSRSQATSPERASMPSSTTSSTAAASAASHPRSPTTPRATRSLTTLCRRCRCSIAENCSTRPTRTSMTASASGLRQSARPPGRRPRRDVPQAAGGAFSARGRASSTQTGWTSFRTA